MILSDIEDSIRWQTTTTLWQNYDEPWEYEGDKDFDEEQYRTFALKEFEQLEKIRLNNLFRESLEIDTAEGVHIGTIDIYFVDKNYRNIKKSALRHTEKYFIAIGIAIYEDKYWNKGYGTNALEAYIDYIKQNRPEEIILQTWSGNRRMLKVAKKLAFTEVFRKERSVKVRGNFYDEISLKLV